MASDNDRLLEQLRAIVANTGAIRDALKTGITITVRQDAEVHRKLDHIAHQGGMLMSLGGELLGAVKALDDLTDTLIAKVDFLLNAQPGSVSDAEKAAIIAEISGQKAEVQAALDKIAASSGPAPVALPDAQVGVAYSASLEPVAGTAPFANAVIGAPAWLVADATAPLLSGTPDAAGDFTFTWTSADSDPETPDVSRRYSLHVA